VLARSPLLRKTPLKRKTPLRSRSLTSKYARRPRNLDFMDFVRWCACALEGAEGADPCHGRMEADHVGQRGGAPGAAPALRKTADTKTIPMCHRHHGQRTNYRGYFRGWDGDRMRLWCDAKIHFYQNLYQNLTQLRQTPWRRKIA
jgi:hypothetical protein